MQITLDEAIRHAMNIAEKQEELAEVCVAKRAKDDCLKCAEEHRQLAEWLRELQERRKERDYWQEKAHSYEQTIFKLTDAISKQPEIIRRPVVGYEGYYEVDNCGRVYAIDRIIRVEDHGRIYDKPLKGEIMKQHMHSEGYKAVCLTKDGKTKTLFVHRIVATAFLPNPDNLPCVNHKDEDKTNNFVDNIEWCSYQYNNAYGSKPKKHSKRMTGRKQSDEQKARRSESLKRYWANKKAERRTDE